MGNTENLRANPRSYDESRRAFIKTILIGGPVALGLAALGIELSDGSLERKGQETADQLNASMIYEQAEKDGQLLEVEVVNPDDHNQSVRIRKNPAILDSNFLTRVRSGKQFKGFLVKPVPGRQQVYPEFAGPWVAIKFDDKMGFILGSLVRRTDGEALTAGQVIYDVRSGERDIFSSGSSK